MPFSLLEADILPGKEVERLTRAQTIKIFPEIINNFEKISLAQYAIRLADEFILLHEKDENIFNLLLSFLDFINSAKEINSLSLATGFIFKLWHCLGFSVDSIWLKSDWPEINNFDEDCKKVYEDACVYAETHSGRKVARFIIL